MVATRNATRRQTLMRKSKRKAERRLIEFGRKRQGGRFQAKCIPKKPFVQVRNTPNNDIPKSLETPKDPVLDNDHDIVTVTIVNNSKHSVAVRNYRSEVLCYLTPCDENTNTMELEPFRDEVLHITLPTEVAELYDSKTNKYFIFDVEDGLVIVIPRHASIHPLKVTGKPLLKPRQAAWTTLRALAELKRG